MRLAGKTETLGAVHTSRYRVGRCAGSTTHASSAAPRANPRRLSRGWQAQTGDAPQRVATASARHRDARAGSDAPWTEVAVPAGWLAFGDMQQVFRGHPPQQGDAPGLEAEEAHYGFTGRPPEQPRLVGC